MVINYSTWFYGVIGNNTHERQSRRAAPVTNDEINKTKLCQGCSHVFCLQDKSDHVVFRLIKVPRSSSGIAFRHSI